MENLTTLEKIATSGAVNNGTADEIKFAEKVCNFVGLNETDSIQALITNPFCYRHNIFWTALITIVFVFIFVCGLVGNIIVIWVIRRPRLRTATNTFILNLAVADLFVIVFCIPSTLLSNVFTPWVLGNLMCKGVAYIQGVSVFASVYSLVAVSVDRARAISRPLELRQGLSKFATTSSIVLIWLTAGIVTSPLWTIFEVVYYPHPYNLPFCIESWSKPIYGQLYFIIVHLIVSYTAPLLFIIVFNTVIWRSVVNRAVPDYWRSTIISGLHRTTRLRVLKMLTSLTFTFFMCWLPLYVTMTIVKFFGFPESPMAKSIFKVFIPFSQIIGSFNSCLNPILYAFLNRKFRETLKSLISSGGVCPISIKRRARKPSWNIQANIADPVPKRSVIVYSASSGNRQSSSVIRHLSNSHKDLDMCYEMSS